MKTEEYSLDDKKTIQNLKDIVRQFCEQRDWDQFHDPKELAIGISTEAGELLQLFRFKNKEQMEQMFKDEIAVRKIHDEIADVLYFTLRFAQLYDIDLSEILFDKIEHNDKKYPKEKVRGNNKKYDEY